MYIKSSKVLLFYKSKTFIFNLAPTIPRKNYNSNFLKCAPWLLAFPLLFNWRDLLCLSCHLNLSLGGPMIEHLMLYLIRRACHWYAMIYLRSRTYGWTWDSTLRWTKLCNFPYLVGISFELSLCFYLNKSSHIRLCRVNKHQQF